jgi:hypothetical protein
MLDGAWWPRSRDPLSELPALIGELAARLGAVFRIGLNHGSWDTQPRQIVTGGRVVKLGWYGPTDAHAIRVFGDRRHHLDLLLVPPETAAASAEAAMATASDAASHARATDVLTAHGITTDIADRRKATAVEQSAGPPHVVNDAAVALPQPLTAALSVKVANGATRANGTRPKRPM